jgi:UDP-2-acetamido-2,6-beta-L-arabino-hexul-4-ose reductase
MKLLVTGAKGFIGKNLVLRLRENPEHEVLEFGRGDSDAALLDAASNADMVFHLAGENRPASPEAFEIVNAGLTKHLCEMLIQAGNRCPLVLASSAQAELDNPYGRSKLHAESAVEQLARGHGNPVAVLRLPGVFGKWCRANYNSVVATFCHNTVNDLPIQISDPSRVMRLVYVDDVVGALVALVPGQWAGAVRVDVQPEFTTTLGELAVTIQSFRGCRTSLVIERVGTGLGRALYATYVSYLPTDRFVYDVPSYGDARGVFVEMLKTKDSGQFSFFTAHPGVTRGSHYHHTKTEKFLVIKGKARFGFRHMVTNQVHYVETVGNRPQIVETVPGWAHDVTNVGDDELVVMLWANEIFDRSLPDTIASKV